MNKQKYLPALALVTASILALSGCQTDVPALPNATAGAIQVDAVSEQVFIEKGEAGFITLDLFLTQKRARYGDRLVVNAADDVIIDIRNRYLAMGIKVLKAPAAGQPEANKYLVVLSRVILTPPNCSDWSEEALRTEGEGPSPLWGCSQQANLVRMIADPHDLIAAESSTVAYDANADMLAVRAYRNHMISVVETTITTEE